MRNEEPPERIRVRCLEELDAIVGKYLTAEKPRVHWEDAHTRLLFDSVEEAIEAASDPFFRQLVQREAPPATVLTEVRQFRRYSSDIWDAWLLVERLTRRQVPLLVRQENGRWLAQFGDREPVSSTSAPVAICLAALRMCGVEIEGDLDAFAASAAG